MTLNPYADALGSNDPLTVMATTPARLAQAVGALSGEQIEVAPAPGKWSVREVLAHLADCEIAFGFRLRQAYGGERMVQPFDQTAWGRAYGAYSAAHALATFTALRAWNVTFVQGLTPDDKLLAVTHPERGDMTLGTIVETIGGHDLHHLVKLQQSA